MKIRMNAALALSTTRREHLPARVLVIAAASALSIGCASYKEVKEMEVSSSSTLTNVEPELFSACVHEFMREEGAQIYHRSYDPINRKWFIVSEFTMLFGGGNGQYNFSISFHSVEDKSTKVEIRSIQSVWGKPQAPTERILQMLKRCQDALNTTEPRKQ